MRQPLRHTSIPKLWQQQKQQSERPKIVCMNRTQAHHRSNASSNQTHHSQKPRNRQVAANPTSYVNGTCLSAMEFRDALHLRYCRIPLNFPTHCDGCGAKFSIAHGLECTEGGLVIQRNDESKFELQDGAARAHLF